MKKTDDALATRLARRLRRARGELTLVQFSRKLGISKSSLQRMESGEQNVTLETLGVLCKRLKCDVGDLFISVEPSDPPGPRKPRK